MTTRDMTETQFRAALKRNGLELHLLWIWRRNPTDDQVNMGVGVITQNGKINFRSSISNALKRFAEADKARARRKAKEAALPKESHPS